MNSTKRISLLSITLLSILNPVMGHAQVVGAPIVVSPGTYNYNNQSQVEIELLRLVAQRGQADKDYVEKTSRQIRSALSSLRAEHLTVQNGKKNLAYFATAYVAGTGKSMQVEVSGSAQASEFQLALVAVQKFVAAEADIHSMIDSLTLIPSALIADDKAVISGSTVELRGFGKIDFSALKKVFNDQIIEIDQQLAQQQVMVTQNSGAAVAQPILKISAGNVYTQAQLTDMRNQAERLMAVKTDDTVRMKQLHLFSMGIIRKTIQVFGDDQKYRANLNKEDLNQVVEDFRTLMWQRSLLRASTGIPGIIGAIGVDYHKQQLNWDIFSSTAGIQWMGEAVTRQDDLIKVRDSLVNKMFQLETRSQDAMALKTYSTAFQSLTNAASAINSLRTFAQGDSQKVAVEVAIMKEVAYDAQEEYLLATGDYEKMRRTYQARWYTGKTDAEVAAIKLRGQSLMKGLGGGATGGATALNGAANAQNQAGIFVIALNTVRDYASRYNNAQQIMAVLKSVQNGQATQQEINSNVDSL